MIDNIDEEQPRSELYKEFLTGEHINIVRRALTRLSQSCPVFSSPAASVLVVDARIHRTSIATMAIDAFGHLYVNADYIVDIENSLKSSKNDGPKDIIEVLQFDLAHTLLHPMLWHMARVGGRNQERFFRACDRAINQALASLTTAAGAPTVCSVPRDALLPTRGQEQWSVEQLYEVEPEGDSGDSDDDKSSNGKANNKVGDGCAMVGPPSEASFAQEEKAKMQWIGYTAAASWYAGTHPAWASLGRVLTPPPARVPWAMLLRNACIDANAIAGRNDITWTRLHRRSFDNDFLYPAQTSAQGRVAVVVDTSGSVSESALYQAVAEIVSISKECATEIFLVAHDAEVTYAGWVHENEATADSVSKSMLGRGGTIYYPAYERVAAEKGQFNAFIHFTDAMPFDDWPRIPLNVKGESICALISMARMDAVPPYMKKVVVLIES